MLVDLQGNAVLPPSHPDQVLQDSLAWWLKTVEVAFTPASKKQGGV